MTLGEFKAWMDGYLEESKDGLSERQLARIRTKLAQAVEENKKTVTLLDQSISAIPPTTRAY